ncbi:DUF885 domain-containing protein [soil metagenome]
MPEAVYQRFESLTTDHRPTPETAYQQALHALLDDLFLSYPVWATQIGYHEYDDRWPDLTGTGRLDRLQMLARQRAAVQGLPDEQLSDDERLDRQILEEVLDALVFDEEVLRESTWDPLSYVYLVGSGFFGLLGREYAPFAHRGTAFLVRMQHLPDVFAAARENLLGLPGRPVSLLHTETALEQLDGIGELIDSAIAEARAEQDLDRQDLDGDRQDPGPDLYQRLKEAAPAARQAVEEFRQFLDEEVRARASGEGRLGPDLFQQKLRHTLSSDLLHGEVLERAQRDYEVVRAEMVSLARELWSTWLADEPVPDQEKAASERTSLEEADSRTVRRVLDAIATEHRQPDELLDFCQTETARIERFVRRNQIIGLPEEPLKITWTPIFMRAYGGAFLDAPGPLDKGQSSYFWITPPGDDWPPERTESYLREDNDRMLRLLCIHEGIPGHYLQLSHANRSTSLTRAIFSSGMFAEGWAVYVTQVMMDVGYGRDDLSLMLIHWKFYLRAITNAIIDVRIHAAGMDEKEAMDLMVRGGFQEEQEARAKWLRARLTSTQLSTYYLGSLEMWDLEVEMRRRLAVEAGAAAEVVPEQRVVGSLGDTPGFDYRDYLERVVGHGMPPIKWVRRILLGDA